MLADDLLSALEERGEKALAPIFLVLGEESFLVEEVARRVREVACAGGVPGFNDDRFTAGEVTASQVVSAARMLPMMGARRYVVVRSVERWEPRSEASSDASDRKKEAPLDVITAYAADPNPSTVLVLIAQKLHGSRKIVTMAKKGDFIVSCDSVARQRLPDWAARRSRASGHAMSSAVADHLVDLLGGELGPLAEAVERLGLFVGQGAPITDDAVSRMIAPIRAGSVWTLTDALCDRDLKKALKVLSEIPLRSRGDALPLLGAVTSSVRKLARLDALLRAGEPLQTAGQLAGVMPFRLQATRDSLRRLPPGTLERWLGLCARADVDLKGGAKRGDRAVVESLVLSMCG
ncbi:MAG: DNA polymerase III subunit delta [Polyangiaceae bacterium]|nr:DNA polymerase III subunit delta [Polyangiaceae bacterium]